MKYLIFRMREGRNAGLWVCAPPATRNHYWIYRDTFEEACAAAQEHWEKYGRHNANPA